MNLQQLLTLDDVEAAARSAVDSAIWAYIAGGAGVDSTVRANVAAFNDVWLRPRIAFQANRDPSTAITLIGQQVSLPVLLAPTSPQRLLHDEAELATAAAAASAGTISIVSTDSHHDFPTIRTHVRGACWFQLYAYNSRATVESTIAMAINAGAGAMVVTIDACYSARRISARRAGFRTPSSVDFGTLRLLGVLTGDVPPDARLARLPVTWDDLAWIRRRSTVPMFVKGVLTREDAHHCVDLGVDGIIVSNHGGRQLDGAVPSIIALEEIVDEVSGKCIILLDGGIRSGVDVIKSIALGADAVCIGRPYLWGLAVDGQQGVEKVLTILRQEIVDSLRQLGLSDIHDVDRACVAAVRWRSERGPWSRAIQPSYAMT